MIMTKKSSKQQKQQQNTPPSPYHTPHLLIYGKVSELTSGGSGNANEGNNGTELNKKRS